jgi:hypothetical protein
MRPSKLASTTVWNHISTRPSTLFSRVSRQTLRLWTVKSDRREIREVVGALLARQTTLFGELAVNPQTWTGHVAPLLLRAMADVYISIAWLLASPEDRCRKFVLFGLGQAKLQLEHHRAEIESHPENPHEREQIAVLENWIEVQRRTFLTDVPLGNWAGISTRQMAEEADCLDFYNFVYSPFSGCVHSMWQHVGRYNLQACDNPLHGGHFVPTIIDVPLDAHYLYLGAKYLAKTFATFDAAMKIECGADSTFEFLCDTLSKVSKSDESKPNEGQVQSET